MGGVFGDDSGAILVLTAVALPLLILLIAFSITTSLAVSEESRLQGAADNAARYAAIMRSQSGGDAALIDVAAKSVAAANGFTHSSTPSANGTTVTVTSLALTNTTTPSASTFPKYRNSVKVDITMSYRPLLPFSLNYDTCPAAGGGTEYCVKQHVYAIAGGITVPCVMSLNPDSGMQKGIKIDGSKGKFKTDCAVMSNSADPKFSIVLAGGTGYGLSCPATADICAGSYLMNGGSQSTFDANASVGTNQGLSNNPLATLTASLADGKPTSICDSDCFKKLPKTTIGGKEYTNIDATKYYDLIDGNAILPANTTVYAGCVKLKNTESVIGTRNAAGTDYLANTLVLLGSGSGCVDIKGSLNITAPTDGTFANIALAGSTSITGTANIKSEAPGLSGVISLPAADITVSGSSAPSTGCQSIFGWTITFSGNITLGKGCDVVAASTINARGSLLVQ